MHKKFVPYHFEVLKCSLFNVQYVNFKHVTPMIFCLLVRVCAVRVYCLQEKVSQYHHFQVSDKLRLIFAAKGSIIGYPVWAPGCRGCVRGVLREAELFAKKGRKNARVCERERVRV